MPADITQLGFVALQNYLKNKPIDQVATERPLLKALMAKKKPWGGGKENIVEQIRTDYGNNFEWFGDSALNTSSAVTYNTRDTVRQAYYPWNSAHDGFQFSEDYLLGNGILIGDSQSPRNSSAAGLVQLTNVFNEAMEVLRLGFEKILDQSLHLDGTIGVGGGTSLANKAINGLDFHRSLCIPHGHGWWPMIVQANTYWRNQIDMGAGLNVTTGATYGNGYPGDELLAPMQTMWRACQKNGGSPNFLLAGTDFITSYEAAVDAKLSRYAVQPGTGQAPWNMDPSMEIKDRWHVHRYVFPRRAYYSGIRFLKILMVFLVLILVTVLTVAMVKALLHVKSQTNHLTLRPIQDNDMIARKPPREHTSYNYYWGMTWRGSLTANRM